MVKGRDKPVLKNDDLEKFLKRRNLADELRKRLVDEYKEKLKEVTESE